MSAFGSYLLKNKLLLLCILTLGTEKHTMFLEKKGKTKKKSKSTGKGLYKNCLVSLTGQVNQLLDVPTSMLNKVVATNILSPGVLAST